MRASHDRPAPGDGRRGGRHEVPAGNKSQDEAQQPSAHDSPRMNTTQQTSNSLSPNVTEGVSASFVSSLYGGSDRHRAHPCPAPSSGAAALGTSATRTLTRSSG